MLRDEVRDRKGEGLGFRVVRDRKVEGRSARPSGIGTKCETGRERDEVRDRKGED